VEKTEHYHEIKRFVISKIVHPEDSEDLTQQVFLEYYETKDRENNIQNHKEYLFGMAKIKIADYYHQKKTQTKFVQLKSELVDNIKLKDTSDQNAIIEELNNLISKLPPKAKQACELILLDNLNYEEAAQKANCSVKVIRKRYYKGLKILRDKRQHISLIDKELQK
jgi:RNA polymerase sigma-70 factor (ECF subfamily)